VSRGWEALRDDLAARLRAREWGPGEVIPGEVDLAAAYGVARATANRAVTALAEAGMLERRKRAGTRVAALPTRQARFRISVIRQEVEARGARYSFALLSDAEAPAPDTVAKALGLDPRTRLRRLETVHRSDGAALAHELRWLDMTVLPPEARGFEGLSANEWLVARVPFLRGTLAFLAEGADPAAARALGVPEGSPCFVTERATFGEAGPITWVRVTHRPGWRIETEL
jgi:GntR family transcriptional regulator, histidine utilization repressor